MEEALTGLSLLILLYWIGGIILFILWIILPFYVISIFNQMSKSLNYQQNSLKGIQIIIDDLKRIRRNQGEDMTERMNIVYEENQD